MSVRAHRAGDHSTSPEEMFKPRQTRLAVWPSLAGSLALLVALLACPGCLVDEPDDDATHGEDDDSAGGSPSDDDSSTDGDGDGHSAEVDCDDNDPSVYPGAPEACNGRDDDCDGQVPLEEADEDGDGYRVCYGDCDDADPTVFPWAPELCNGLDDDCDGELPPGDLDGDGDGLFLCGGDCDDGNPFIGAEFPELCDGLDNDCDGVLPEDEMDGDGDGFLACEDCDDAEPTTHPGALEQCDGVDNDCDPGTAEDPNDADGDGYRVCDNDCDDLDPAVNPGVEEMCNDGIDNDCDGGSGGCELWGEYSLADADAKLEGETHGIWAGWDVAGGVDVDGDGLDDLLVGAPSEWSNGVAAGAAYLIRPPLAGFQSLATADLKLLGESEWDHAGYTVAFAGDLDGDGAEDLLIGANTEGTAGQNAGATYLISSILSPGTHVLDEAFAKLLGEQVDSYAGEAVSAAGDVDGDGSDDVLIGSFGRVYIVYGPVQGTFSLASADVVLESAAVIDSFGEKIAGGEDVDGDGHDDVLVGAPTDWSWGSSAYLFTGPMNSVVDAVNAEAHYTAEDGDDLLGSSLTFGGDLDGDGISDIVVGAMWEDTGAFSGGAIYLVSAPADSPGEFQVDDVSTAKLVGTREQEHAGYDLAVAGDVNGDGFNDLLVGASGYQVDGGLGAAYLAYGPITEDTALSTTGARFVGEADWDDVGRSISSGEVNGDGYSDLVISAKNHEAPEAPNAGAVYIVYGRGM